MGLVKGEGFAVDASVLEANASRYHGKAPEELDWSEKQRQSRAVTEYLAALDEAAEPNPECKVPKVISPSDPRDLHEDARNLARRKMKTKAFARSRDERKRDALRAPEDPPRLRAAAAARPLRRTRRVPPCGHHPEPQDTRPAWSGRRQTSQPRQLREDRGSGIP
jgi:hypothetical protein